MSKLIFNYIFIIAVLTFSSLSIAMDEGQERDLRSELNELKDKISDLEEDLTSTMISLERSMKNFNELVDILNNDDVEIDNTKPKSFLEIIETYSVIGIFACLFGHICFVAYKNLTKKPKNKTNAFNELETYNQHFHKNIKSAKILEN